MAKKAPAGPPPITTAVSPLLRGRPPTGEDEEPAGFIGCGRWFGAERREWAHACIRPDSRECQQAIAPRLVVCDILCGHWSRGAYDTHDRRRRRRRRARARRRRPRARRRRAGARHLLLHRRDQQGVDRHAGRHRHRAAAARRHASPGAFGRRSTARRLPARRGRPTTSTSSRWSSRPPDPTRPACTPGAAARTSSPPTSATTRARRCSRRGRRSTSRAESCWRSPAGISRRSCPRTRSTCRRSRRRWRTTCPGMAQALDRDSERLQASYARVNRSPLGAAALATSGFALDRDAARVAARVRRRRRELVRREPHVVGRLRHRARQRARDLRAPPGAVQPGPAHPVSRADAVDHDQGRRGAHDRQQHHAAEAQPQRDHRACAK